MSTIVLATINARFIHAAVGLRYLFANLGELQPEAQLLEFDLKQRAPEIAAEILAQKPKIVGMGVYIWNTALTTEVLAIIRKVAPEIKLIVGGPEVSHETDGQSVVSWADHVITGEADLEFGRVCRRLLDANAVLPKVIRALPPPLEHVRLPYALYTDKDLAHRVLYVEASRGCPFTCEFCLSSLDEAVRNFEWEPLSRELKRLMERGARVFKFVDRTFNLSLKTSTAILEFFLKHWETGMFVHFEMVPDRIHVKLLELLKHFPSGGVQLEVGIQTFNETTAQLISRRQDYSKLENNLRYLRENTGVHVHADLIAGLPGEDLESFGRGFDRLHAMAPQEIQVGILKRLRGTPIIRHEDEWEMVYNPSPPYEILRNRLLSFDTVQRLKRFSRYWDLLANSGRFPRSLPLLWSGGNSPFHSFLKLSDWLGARFGRDHSVALVQLAEGLYHYLDGELNVREAGAALHADWTSDGAKRERLPFLTPVLATQGSGTASAVPTPSKKLPNSLGNARQKRHAPGDSRN